jgi:hypothetical protein
MDHQEEHHLHHRKEREREIQHENEWERRQEAQVRTIHPAWFVALGAVLIAGVVAAWTFLF